MSYTAQRLVTYPIAVSEAIGALTMFIQAPCAGHLWDIQLDTTTTWAGATNQLIVEVGTAADADLYGELRSGLTAAGVAQSARYANTADVSIIHETTNKFDKGAQIKVTITPPAGSGEAGVGRLYVVLAFNG